MIFSLQKHLGYFNHIFRLSEFHQCDTEMLLNISLSLVSEDLFVYIPGIVNQSHATKELSISGCTISNRYTKKCWFIGFLKGDTNLYGFKMLPVTELMNIPDTTFVKSTQSSATTEQT